MRIGAVSVNHYQIYNQNKDKSRMHYGKIASGKRINSAADDAAGLVQVGKLVSQNRALTQGAYNARAGQSLTRVADGALSGIHDYLSNIKALSVKALNGTNTAADRRAIQNEIDGYLQGIDQLAGSTTFNTKHILNGEESLDMALNPDASGPKVGTVDSTLKALGLDGYDVTSGKFDMDRLDKAIDQVSKLRSQMGASDNALEYGYNYNMNAAENLTGAQSRIEDLDMPAAISEQRKNEVLQDYRNMMLRSQMNDASLVTRMFQN